MDPEQSKSGAEEYLYTNHRAKLFVNQCYTYFIHMVHGFLNIMPGPIRNLGFKLMLKRAGSAVYFDYNVYIKFPRLVTFGDRVSINRGVAFYPDYFSRSTITIGSDVRIAPGAQFHGSGHEWEDLAYAHKGAPIVVGDHVWIGANAIILSGVTIGDRSVVAAGSVVTNDVPPDTLVGGIPARVIKERDHE